MAARLASIAATASAADRAALTSNLGKHQMSNAPLPHREWVKFLRTHVGENWSVLQHYNEDRSASIPIISIESDGAFVAATIGLMDTNQAKKPTSDLRTEVVACSRSKDDVVCNVLATSAFYVLTHGWRMGPGTIFETMVSMYRPETKLPHVYFTAPMEREDWGSIEPRLAWDEWGNVSLSNRLLHPLIAVPISEAESKFVSQASPQELEAIWKTRGTDIFDWDRDSAV
jgi:hypothetical protein